MDKGVGKFHYSYSSQEAKKEKTLIAKYKVFDVDGKQITTAWLEYARSYNIINSKKIEENNFKHSRCKRIWKINDLFWEAFVKNKKLTAFEDKGIVKIVGADKNMDTIILKPNKNDFFYIIKY
jgi:hypothetical protein